jgi:hypothetical protein
MSDRFSYHSTDHNQFISTRYLSLSLFLSLSLSAYKSVPWWCCLRGVQIAAILIIFTLVLVLSAIAYDLALVFNGSNDAVVGPG